MSNLIPVGNTQDSAKKKCIELSKQHIGMYVYAVPAFGLFAVIKKRLPVFAPSSTPFKWYILNGKVKQFTKAQAIADQNATPVMH